MANGLHITTTGIIGLTSRELDVLRETLNSGDRGGFYNVYSAMTGSDPADLQSRISTFSYAAGGVAFAANRLLQEVFAPGAGNYPGIYLLSHEVAKKALAKIEETADSEDASKLNDNVFRQTAAEAWTQRGVGNLFPGNALDQNGNPDFARLTSAATSFFTDLSSHQNWDANLIRTFITQSTETGVHVSMLATISEAGLLGAGSGLFGMTRTRL